jgi:hypothetical protein
MKEGKSLAPAVSDAELFEQFHGLFEGKRGLRYAE